MSSRSGSASAPERTLPRRGFVRSLPLLVLAPPLLADRLGTASTQPRRTAAAQREPRGQPTPAHRQVSADRQVPAGQEAPADQEATKPGFAGPLTAEEEEAVAASAMAQEIMGLHGKGYPCSEMILLAALHRFELEENYLDAAAVFGGGMGKRDVCGLLTGAIMAIGLAAGKRFTDRAELHRASRGAANAYWDWWVSRGDQHCYGPGTTHETPEEFVRMTQRAAVRLEEVMTTMLEADTLDRRG